VNEKNGRNKQTRKKIKGRKEWKRKRKRMRK